MPLLTHLCRVDYSTLTLRTGQFPISGVSGCFLSLSYFLEISELNANSVDPDQTLRSAASDLGLYCLPRSLLWDLRLKWVKWVMFVILSSACMNAFLFCFVFSTRMRLKHVKQICFQIDIVLEN